jgi:hypothetical protein
MSLLLARAYFSLLYFEPFLFRGQFASLYDVVRRKHCDPVSKMRPSVEQICYAIDLASIWYWKQVLCLQRSAATVFLLRSCGIEAQLIIGAQLLPFEAHAWVEVDGLVVNDKSYIKDIYAVLDRC